jgi:ABC-type polysaccharide/polyol phosphate transport system ATPase subunit
MMAMTPTRQRLGVLALARPTFDVPYAEEMAARRSRSDLILVSHQAASIKAQCDMAAVLHGGTLTFFEDVGAAIRLYSKL